MVIAAVDFSDATDLVLEAAAAWARGAPVLVLHVAPSDPEYVTLRVGPDAEREDVARHLRDRRAQVRKAAGRLGARGMRTEGRLVRGSPHEAIVEEASRGSARLIVLGSHCHTRLHDVLLGSVTESVLRRAPCPVLVVPVIDATATSDPDARGG